MANDPRHELSKQLIEVLLSDDADSTSDALTAVAIAIASLAVELGIPREELLRTVASMYEMCAAVLAAREREQKH